MSDRPIQDEDVFPEWAVFEHELSVGGVQREGWRIESRGMDAGILVAILHRPAGRGLTERMAVTGDRYGNIVFEPLQGGRQEQTSDDEDDDTPPIALAFLGVVKKIVVAVGVLAALVGTMAFLILEAVTSPSTGTIILAVISPFLGSLAAGLAYYVLDLATAIILIPLLWIFHNPFREQRQQPPRAPSGEWRWPDR